MDFSIKLEGVRPGGYPRAEHLKALPPNIGLGWKGLQGQKL
jgi:hypothetical protein